MNDPETCPHDLRRVHRFDPLYITCTGCGEAVEKRCIANDQQVEWRWFPVEPFRPERGAE